jgi:hypothetical protein
MRTFYKITNNVIKDSCWFSFDELVASFKTAGVAMGETVSMPPGCFILA